MVITHDGAIAASLPRQVEVLDGRIQRDSGLETEPGVAVASPATGQEVT